MKKTLHINLNGFAFHIEEDAYEKLEQYLNKIERSFADVGEAKEIISDIEARIAEIFQGSHSSADEVITLENVEEVIKTMGEPQDIVDDEEEHEKAESEKKSKATNASSTYTKRLYRDTDNRVFGGVCSGLGAYFGTDPLVFRIIFLLSFIIYGVSLLPYFILWIVMPKAVTITQKLEMRGPADYEKWEQNIRNEYKDVSDRFKKSRAYQNMNQGFSQSSDKMGHALRKVVQIFGAFIGVIIMLATLVSLVSIIMTFTFGYTLFDYTGVGGAFASLPSLFLEPFDITLGTIGILILTGIPLLLLFFVGFKLVFRFKTRTGLVFLIGLLIWIGGWVVVAYSAAKATREFREYESVYDKQVFEQPNAKTIFLKPNKSAELLDYKEHLFDVNQLNVYLSDEDIIVQGNPKIELVEGVEFSIDVKKSARGNSVMDAKSNCNNIEFFWLQKDSVLYIDSKYSLTEGAKIRDQKLKVVITVPEYYNVELDDELKWVIDNELN